MSDTSASLKRMIHSAGDLQSVVRTMKALAGSNISHYERSVSALAEFSRTVELGLSVCLRPQAFGARAAILQHMPVAQQSLSAIVFGSDQGLVGAFNEVIAQYAVERLETMPGKPRIWVVGERLHACLLDSGLEPEGLFEVPHTVHAITPLVGQIQLASDAHREPSDAARFYVFHNQPQAGAGYAPVSQRLLPLDAQWQAKVEKQSWPSNMLPECFGNLSLTLGALIREHLFISLFRACAESLASENASRLAAMTRAERNIAELMEQLQGRIQRLRQSAIDAELFDVIAGFEGLASDSVPS